MFPPRGSRSDTFGRPRSGAGDFSPFLRRREQSQAARGSCDSRDRGVSGRPRWDNAGLTVDLLFRESASPRQITSSLARHRRGCRRRLLRSTNLLIGTTVFYYAFNFVTRQRCRASHAAYVMRKCPTPMRLSDGLHVAVLDPGLFTGVPRTFTTDQHLCQLLGNCNACL